MPNGDKTGPNGAGPMTGNRRGSCRGGNAGGFFGGRGGFGRGVGQAQGGNINLSLEEEEMVLKNRLKAIQETKKADTNK